MSTYKTHFAYRIDRWDANSDSVIDHVAGVDDLTVAKATYEAACKRCSQRFTCGLRILHTEAQRDPAPHDPLWRWGFVVGD